MAGPFPLTRSSVEDHARSGWKGVYQLRRSRTGPIRYVGRSDTDVRKRLMDHVRADRYSYFTVDHKRTTEEAWLREANLYHFHREDLDNQAHPAPPKGMSCPGCSGYD